MIISASRRTDIPALYGEWFTNRIRAGECLVPNPFNPKQVSRVSLRPEDVDVIAFWTRFARPFMSHLPTLDAHGYRYYFLFTIVDHGRCIEPRTPALDDAIASFRELAAHVGPERMIWRYDPIALTETTGIAYHCEQFARIASALRGTTNRCVISLVDLYRKVRSRFAQQGVTVLDMAEQKDDSVGELIASIAASGKKNDMIVTGCAESCDLSRWGVEPAVCIDSDWIHRVFGIQVSGRKDPGQRKQCRCVVSRDIGMYDTCPMGCLYCYATKNADRARQQWRQHDPRSACLFSAETARRE